MSLLALMWILVVLVVVALLFLMVYNMLVFDELVNDHKNPNDVCKSINPWVLPEYGAQAALTIMFLASGNIVLFLTNAIVTSYHAYRYINRPRMTHVGIYDPGTIFNQSPFSNIGQNVQLWRIESAFKLGFYLICFFFYLYSMMYALLS
eukprot:m.20330 g.20330  ORF g.20330 m.20330 type:complete len:149 (+) comp5241_c0_seq1:70-516(+)